MPTTITVTNAGTYTTTTMDNPRRGDQLGDVTEEYTQRSRTEIMEPLANDFSTAQGALQVRTTWRGPRDAVRPTSEQIQAIVARAMPGAPGAPGGGPVRAGALPRSRPADPAHRPRHRPPRRRRRRRTHSWSRCRSDPHRSPRPRRPRRPAPGRPPRRPPRRSPPRPRSPLSPRPG